jgi:hypothetical protein
MYVYIKIGGWSKLHNGELFQLYTSSSIIRIIELNTMKWAGHLARIGEERNSYRLLIRKPEGKRPLARTESSWADNIKIDLLEIEWGGAAWIDLAQDRDKWRVL